MLELGETFELTRREQSERLPPLSRAPILQILDRVGHRRFMDNHAIETPIDEETGLVDHDALLQEVSKMVDPTYQWKAPFFDQHHLYWYAHRYASSFHINPRLASEFRDIATNKLWVPRQFHNFVHTVTLPPPIPHPDIMRAAVKQYRRERFIHRAASDALMLYQRINNSELKVSQDGKVALFVDPVSKRAVPTLDGYEEQRSDFISFIEKAHSRGLIDLSRLTSVDVVDARSIEEALPDIVTHLDDGLVRAKGKLVGLAVDLSYQKAA